MNNSVPKFYFETCPLNKSVLFIIAFFDTPPQTNESLK
jgi:hypothetical protein